MRPRRHTSTLAALLVAAPLALLVGCGGGDDAPITAVTTETQTTPVLSKTEYIDQADGICAEANAAIANLTTTTDQTLLISQEREITEGMLSSLRSLGTPTEDATTLESYLSEVEKQIKILEREQTAAQSGDTASLSTLSTELAAAKSAALTAAQTFGFEQCGQQGEVITPGAPTDTAPAPTPAPTPTTPPAADGGGGGVTPPSDGGDAGGGSGGVSPG